ncbi:aminotransferase class IV [Bacteriovorax sp. Seq25_V]|uniref:aminotransferase class IV n=1 Tax=Bacteriovorax sp. Seq25_V TaxID=1201288 RepID=UPI000389DA1C|nr:aminotransferase class IV [Bacteriovorax sp. Seq25_V]EQC47235.1 aminotransferase, class IV [Bacteriovorax sp. Seq25_V]
MRVEVISELSACNYKLNENSGYLYGQSVFTSSNLVDGELPFMEEHLERLQKGVAYLFNEKRPDFSPVRENLKLISSNGETTAANYIRITISKMNDEFLCLIYLGNKLLVTREVSLKTHRSLFNNGMPPYVKLGNYAFQFRAKIIAEAEGYDDVLMVHDRTGNILDTSTSNIFFTKGKSIFFAPLQFGVFDGILRRNLIEFCRDEKDIKLVEYDINVSSIADFDGAFITNSFSGIRVVKRIDDIELNESPLAEKFKKNGFLWKRKN